MKKFISLLIIITLISALCLTANAESTQIKVLLDGRYIEFGVEPVIIEGRTLVPARAVFEALGASVDWIPETRTVVSKHDNKEIRLSIDDKTLYKNEAAVELDVPASLISSTTMVPVRAISEAFDCTVFWNSWNKTVIVFSNPDNVAAATINGENISTAYYNFVLSQAEYSVMQNMGISHSDILTHWNTPIQGSTTLGEYISSLTLDQCYYIKANAQKAKSLGIELSVTDSDDISSTISAMADSYGENYEQILKDSGTTLKAVEEALTENKYAEKYYNTLNQEHGMKEQDAKKFLDENYIRAKHILFSIIDSSTGEPLSIEMKNEKRKLAEATLKRIKKGEDFDKLMKEFSEDPGSSYYPDGYLFTKGEMVSEFEEGAYSLRIGSTSEIIESAYGYHIIKRLKNGEYSNSDLNIAYSQTESKISEIMNANLTNANTTLNSNIYLNVIPF